MIRKAEKRDLSYCSELFCMAKQEVPEAYDGIEIDNLRNDLDSGMLLVAEEHGHVVGMISAIPAPKKTVLYMLVCHPDYRGGTLAPELIEEASKRHGNVMAITVPHAKASFEKAKFRQTGFVMEHP